MIKLKNANIMLDDLTVLEDINFNFGRETYLLAGRMVKRKNALLEELAFAASKYNPNIKYHAENGVVYLPTNPILIEGLTVKQNIQFYSRFFGTTHMKVKVLINHFEIENILERKVKGLNVDVIKLVQVICVFLNTEATVYLLSDPFANLNKYQIDLIKTYLKQIERDITIIFSKLNSHEIEEFKPRIIEIKDKKLVFEEN
ncbi:hypothetical protein R2F61_00490 [Mollicutes bacterium LVI A0078]|nr:hypothetical protein RZE84_00495 [Mollicutes bacterium LVI A0075]WOO91058.1 hypothetical protein R2F61_00490 [Mollicutes bacterium LVI A0078]